MTPRLQAARADVARLIERYMRPYAQGRIALEAAIAELEAAARVEDDQPSDPPVIAVPPPADALAEAVARAGIEVVSPQTLPAAPPEPPGTDSVHTIEPPELPTAKEAVQDALAPHDVTPEHAKTSKRKKS